MDRQSGFIIKNKNSLTDKLKVDKKPIFVYYIKNGNDVIESQNSMTFFSAMKQGG